MNDPNRREFISRITWLGSAALASLTNPLSVWALAPIDATRVARKKEVMLDQLTIGNFSPHLGDKFVLRLDALQSLELKLIEATSLGSKGPRPAHLAQREPFSIVFRAPQSARLSQHIYRLEHEQMGEFDVFLVPIGLDKDGLRCEAIFN